MADPGRRAVPFEDSPPPGPLDLGGGVRLAWLFNADGRLVGFAVTHPRARATRVAGDIQLAGSPCCIEGLFDLPRNGRSSRFKWRVLSWQPLTLAQSVRCRTCGSYGWVRDGRWEPV